ncbi:MAG: QueT transporter family protein [Actinobacteria bacterium]|nr:QueT transporter family protein [Actinomycetota bacterium]
MKKTRFVARAGMIAAVYAVLTLLTVLFLQGFAWGPVQFRVSEATCVLAVLTGAAVPGLTIGCLVANLIAIPITGSGLLGLLDVFFGTLATFLGALWTRKFRAKPKLALLGPILSNALIVPAYLPILLSGYGFYTIPFTDISLDGAYVPMYLFGVVAIALGEAVVLYGLGLPLLQGLRRFGVLASEDEN